MLWRKMGASDTPIQVTRAPETQRDRANTLNLKGSMANMNQTKLLNTERQPTTEANYGNDLDLVSSITPRSSPKAKKELSELE